MLKLQIFISVQSRDPGVFEEECVIDDYFNHSILFLSLPTLNKTLDFIFSKALRSTTTRARSFQHIGTRNTLLMHTQVQIIFIFCWIFPWLKLNLSNWIKTFGFTHKSIDSFTKINGCILHSKRTNNSSHFLWFFLFPSVYSINHFLNFLQSVITGANWGLRIFFPPLHRPTHSPTLIRFSNLVPP